jgi:multimeric flavodoxin WrbA
MSSLLETDESSSAVREVLLASSELRKAHVEKLASDLSEHRAKFEDDLDAIKKFIAHWQPLPVGHKYLQNRMESLEPELKAFFENTQALVPKAMTSNAALKHLEKSLGWYTKSGDAAALVKVTVDACKGDLSASVEREILSTLRTELGQIHPSDERFFQAYLNAGRPPLTVYRGDGRGANAQSLNGFVRQAIPAGGTADVTFFGVVQHLESSTNKNGMVSTTTDRTQALDWALDGKKFGLLYTLQVTHYIDTIDLLRQRNFKHRFPAQLEILVPAQIPVGEIVLVEHFNAARTLLGTA